MRADLEETYCYQFAYPLDSAVWRKPLEWSSMDNESAIVFVMPKLSACAALITLLVLPACAFAQADETTLYDSNGKATAYIADDMTIYLWSGKPVAYLHSGSEGTDVYGFNGKHIGWFQKGYIRDNDGDAACGVKAVIRSPQLDPLKSLKELKPLKALEELEPLKPMMSMSWSDTPCRVLLGLGVD